MLIANFLLVNTNCDNNLIQMSEMFCISEICKSAHAVIYKMEEGLKNNKIEDC